MKYKVKPKKKLRLFDEDNYLCTIDSMFTMILVDELISDYLVILKNDIPEMRTWRVNKEDFNKKAVTLKEYGHLFLLELYDGNFD